MNLLELIEIGNKGLQAIDNLRNNYDGLFEWTDEFNGRLRVKTPTMKLKFKNNVTKEEAEELKLQLDAFLDSFI